jgi:hypothetical protein
MPGRRIICGASSSSARAGLGVAGERPAGKTPFGLGFRAAFGFRLLRTAQLFLAFPRFGRGPLFKFAGLSLFADLGLDLGTLPIFHLAFTGIGKGARAGFPFLFRQRT